MDEQEKKQVNLKPNADNVSSVTYRVLYADTDQMGVVYHGNYFRWFEGGRADYMRKRSMPYSTVEKENVQLPVIEANAMYIKPAKYDDVISVTAWISDMAGAQLTFGYLISRDSEKLVKGYTRHAAVNRLGRPVRIPDFVKNALLNLENDS